MALNPTATNERLAKILERQNLLPLNVISGLTAKALRQSQWLGKVAVDDGALSAKEIADLLAQETKLPYVELEMAGPDPRALDLIPLEMARNLDVIPLQLDGSQLYVAMANPLDDTAKLALREAARCEVAYNVAPMDQVARAIGSWYNQAAPRAAAPSAASPNFSSILGNMTPEPPPPPTPTTAPGSEMTIEELLTMMIEHRASDLHLAVGSPPQMRVDGELQPMPYPMLKPQIVQPIIYSILTDVQITAYERHWELDFSYSLPGVSRFRVNVHRQRGSVGAVFRSIPSDIPTLDKLKMPPIVRELTNRPRGLVLVTGPTGSGKSTTLAAMVDEINRNHRTHIVTIEDPIEFLHNNKLSVITQREVGSDTESFTVALRHVLRQDPDVILIGEMRDLETIAAALTAAETGHLVFATLHTTSAASTIDRIVDVFPEHQQDQVRTQLANVLEGILTQTLLQHIDGHGRCCAQEIMLGNAAIRTLIRDNKVHQMPGIIQASGKLGMQTLDQALRTLVLKKMVTLDEAMTKASNPDDFKALLAMQ